MANVGVPSPGLFASVLHTLRATDPREQTFGRSFAALINALTEAEAELLPAAISGVMPLLEGDADRFRFAAEALVRFDMYEAAPALARIALDTQDPELLLSAAALCGNPGVDQTTRVLVAEGLTDRVGRIRLDPTTQPDGERELLLYLQRWPGRRSRQQPPPLAPVIVLDVGLGSLATWRFALMLDAVGATIRRLPAVASMPDWFGPQTVVCCRPNVRSKILSNDSGFPERQILVNPELDTERDMGSILRRINSALGDASRLRLEVFGPEITAPLWDPAVYALGAYETREAAFLTSAPLSSLHLLSKSGLLHPRRTSTTIWSFSDLVAVRTWRYLTASSPGRVSKSVVPALAAFAGDPEAVRVGATSDGKVFVDRGDGWVDVQSGEQLLDLPIADLDAAFRPFTIGAQRVPDMLHASEHTRLHPAVLHGAPHLDKHRISARALALLDERGGHAAIYGSYPELEGKPIEDTIAVGHQLVGAR